jgi:hypothetical protein
MPATPVGLAGSIGDPAASQALGALCTGIGYGYSAIARPNSSQNQGPFAIDAAPTVHRIGSTPTEEAFAAGFTSKRLRYKAAAAGVAINAQVAATPFSVLNRTGVALLTGDGVFAVEA